MAKAVTVVTLRGLELAFLIWRKDTDCDPVVGEPRLAARDAVHSLEGNLGQQKAGGLFLFAGWNASNSKGLGAGGRGVFMRTNRTPDEWDKWCRARERIIKELKEYYRTCATGELPPQLLALSKTLDEELLKKREHCVVA